MSGRGPRDEEGATPTRLARARRAAGRPRSKVPPDLILELRRQGLSFREIARHTGCGYGTVRRAYWASELGAIGDEAGSFVG